MKTKLLFSFVCYLVLQANAQMSNNTIVNDNSAWATLSYIALDDSGNALTQYHFFDGDSIFNEKTYKKIFYYRDEQHTKRFFAGLIREENLKTYCAPYHIGLETLLEERVLYNFSLEQGDTFEYPISYSETETLYVLQSDSVLINNEQKKRLIIVPENNINWVIDTIIENVGSLHGLLYPLCYMCDGAFHELLCYTENGELVYQNPNRTKCYYDKLTLVQTIEIRNCSVFPNAVDDVLYISCLNNEILRIEIFDNLGRQIYKSYKNTIDVSSFSKGLYLLKIYDTNGQVSVFKIIKK